MDHSDSRSHAHKPRFNFRLYDLSLRALRLTVRVIRAIARHDANLADQGMRAATSWHLNIAEGMNAPGKTKNLRYRSALCSVDEVIGVCDIGEALGYVTVTEEEADVVQHVRATLINLLRAVTAQRRRDDRDSARGHRRARCDARSRTSRMRVRA